MLDIKLRMEDLEDIKEIYSDFEMELGFTVDTLEEAIEYMKDELNGKYKDKFIEIFQEQISQINEYRESAAELYKFVSTVIEDINDTVDIENEQICFEYDEELFKKLVDNAEELLDSSSYDYKRIVEMSCGFEDWYNSEQNKLSIHIDSNKTLISQTSSSIEERLRLHDDKKVLNHNYNVIKNLDNKLKNINFNKEIEELHELQTGLNKLELLNEYVGVQSFNGFDSLFIASIGDIPGGLASVGAMKDLQTIKKDSIKKSTISFSQNELGGGYKNYSMYEWIDSQGKLHQFFFRPNPDYGFYATISVPNGVIINDGEHDIFVSHQNYDEYKNKYKVQLENKGIYSEKDLYEIAKYNASKEGSIAVAKASLEAIKYDYPEFSNLTDDELIQEISNIPITGIVSLTRNLLRSGYTLDDYAKEIQGHAQLFINNIGVESSEIADISPVDPWWQTIIWEVSP